MNHNGTQKFVLEGFFMGVPGV